MLKWSELSARERDSLVAERVMGLKPGVIAAGDYTLQVWDGKLLPDYSTEIAAAWEVLVKANVLALYQLPEGWRAVIGRGEWTADAHTAPEAICLSALKACGVDIS